MVRYLLRRRLIAIVALFAPCSWAADPAVAQVAVERLTEILGADKRAYFAERLADSGLPAADILRIASQAVHEYSKCIVDALAESEDPRSQELLALLAQASTRQDIRDAIEQTDTGKDSAFEASLGPVVKPCMYSVNQELGLPADDDAT